MQIKSIVTRISKKKLVTRIVILGTTGVLFVGVLVIFQKPVGLDSILSFVLESLGKSVAESVE